MPDPHATSVPLRALYLCYLSLDDPLTHTQVIAYLAGLAAAGHEIHLATFEPRRLTGDERRERRAALAAQGIHWRGLRYHKRPSLPATMLDTLAGAMLIHGLGRLDVVHARSHVPAAMALLARRTSRDRPALIFDVRGLMAEEYVDAGRWRRDGVPWRLTKAVERRAVRDAAGGVVLTERVREQLFGDRDDVLVIPCCADVERIEQASRSRDATRAALGIPADATVLVYVGKFSGWYMAQEMAQFFARARELEPVLHLLVLTQSEHDEIERELRVLGVPQAAYTLTSAPHDEVGAHLAAADAAISFIAPRPSKSSSSPTKIGEYLAAGLPIACTAGVGDLDAQLTPDVGVLVDAHDESAHRAAAKRLFALARDPETAARCRATAHRLFSLREVGIPRYRALYERIGRAR